MSVLNIVILAILTSTAAFTPTATTQSRGNALQMAFSSELGAQAPLGFWDPLGLLNDADQERFDRLRYVETKHGRISMLAILGHLVTTAGVRWPGEIAYGLKFADVPTGLKSFDVIPPLGLAQIITFIGLMELGFNARQEELEQTLTENYPDFVTDRRKAVELNNGRAAQMGKYYLRRLLSFELGTNLLSTSLSGILALMVHEKLDNNPYILNSLLGAPVDFNAGF
jgi:hypothetical protein